MKEMLPNDDLTLLFLLSCAVLSCAYILTPSTSSLYRPYLMMEYSSSSSWWFPLVIAVCVVALLKPIIDTFFFAPSQKKLPPGPRFFPLFGNYRWIFLPFSQVETILNQLHSRYGPIITVYVGRHPFIFISGHEIAHLALVQNGAAFANRPSPFIISRIVSSYRININTAPYGPTWRLFRRNLITEMLHPSKTQSFSKLRRRSLDTLLRRLRDQPGGEVVAMDHFRHAMFCLLVLMCFGDRIVEDDIERVEECQRLYLLRTSRFNILNFWPRLGKIILRKRWRELYWIRDYQKEVFGSLIRARSKFIQESCEMGGKHESTVAYVDSLLNLMMPKETRKLDEEEVISLCSEFLIAGTDTTSTALQWIMANMVKYPNIQDKVYEEIRGVVRPEVEEIEEDHLKSMPYLKAVVLEGLRRHPPGHFLLPHKVTKDVELNGYVIPKKGIINFMVARMGLDPKVWEDPMEFRPERFLESSRDSESGGVGEAFDVTGNREIKMMPFGAGRRICPAYGLGILHLEYFLANLIWRYQWKAVVGDKVDLSEKMVFTVEMKKPLRALISPRLLE